MSGAMIERAWRWCSRGAVALLFLLALSALARAARPGLLEAAAAAGSKQALVTLAGRLELGIGVAPDPARAMALFCRAALAGDRAALLHIADWLLVPDAPSYDPRLAARWLHRLQRGERHAALGAAPRCPTPASTALPSIASAVRRLIAAIAPRYGLDPNLVRAVVTVESNFQVGAVSAAGARGLMQLMPASAARFDVVDPGDAEQNLYAGMRDLASLIHRYHGDLRLALAAYNAGVGAVDRCACVPAIPETVAYVHNVLALYRRASRREARALVEGHVSSRERFALIAAQAR